MDVRLATFAKAQKFEYATEACWKAMKGFLKEVDGKDAAAIDDRNRLSHIYDEAVYQSIIARLPDYVTLYRRIQTTLVSNTQ